MKKYNYILIISLLFIITSCGISEDCFKGNGSRITQTFPLENFTKIKVYDGVGLIIKEGPNYEVTVKTSDNIIDDLDVRVDGDMLIVKDNSTCNIARDYGQTVVYVTTPNLEEIHCKTDQDIKSDGVLSFPNLKLLSIDLTDGAGTGDFYLTLNAINFTIETNNVSNFTIFGNSLNSTLAVYWGNGKIDCSNFLIQDKITFFHRGSNDIIINPITTLTGTIYATGNVIIKNNPIQPPTVIQLFTGRLINDF